MVEDVHAVERKRLPSPCTPLQLKREVITITTLLILFLISSAILIGISIPLIQRRVGPNPFYSFRVRRTMEDPKVWYPVNAYSGRRLFVVGVLVMIVATALYFVPDIDVAVYASLVGVIAIGGLIVAVVQSVRYLNRLTTEPQTPF